MSSLFQEDGQRLRPEGPLASIFFLRKREVRAVTVNVSVSKRPGDKDLPPTSFSFFHTTWALKALCFIMKERKK